ncbi:hypothetical protein, partial [Staphylococcus epidermidis]|uniref:hypothetical protein n=1 Tax=Staphylococcus epidermidis TaxID=1282 RepID=UPI0028CB1342
AHNRIPTIQLRKIPNTLRFILRNINHFNPQTHTIPQTNLLQLHPYFLNPLPQFTPTTINNYHNFHYFNIYQQLQNFINLQ